MLCNSNSLTNFITSINLFALICKTEVFHFPLGNCLLLKELLEVHGKSKQSFCLCFFSSSSSSFCFSFIPLSKNQNRGCIGLLKNKCHGTYQNAKTSKFNPKYPLRLPVSQTTNFSHCCTGHEEHEQSREYSENLSPRCDSVIPVCCFIFIPMF